MASVEGRLEGDAPGPLLRIEPDEGGQADEQGGDARRVGLRAQGANMPSLAGAAAPLQTILLRHLTR